MTGRGLLYVRPAELPDGPGLELACDCGAVTGLHLEFGGDEHGPVLGEVAITCPGCSTAHWLSITPREASP